MINMEYHGKLYGKIGNKYFDTSKTSDDYDNLEKQNKALLDEIEELNRRVIYWNELHGEVIKDNVILQSELKAADSDYQSQIAILEQKVILNYNALLAADSVNEWISVEDRLPTERVEFVLLFNADAPKYNQCVYQGVWFLQEKKFKSDAVHNLLGTVTHWMPLPNNPKTN